MMLNGVKILIQRVPVGAQVLVGVVFWLAIQCNKEAPKLRAAAKAQC